MISITLYSVLFHHFLLRSSNWGILLFYVLAISITASQAHNGLFKVFDLLVYYQRL